MSVEFKTLDNGITIINDQIDFESASIGVWIGTGTVSYTHLTLPTNREV